MDSDLLDQIHLEHRKRGHNAMRGMNFVECFTCSFHAHTSVPNGDVFAHGRGNGKEARYRVIKDVESTFPKE